MKLLHKLIPFIVAACGTTPPDESTGCQYDKDCKQNRICLEEICQEQIPYPSDASLELDASQMLSGFNGTIYATARGLETRTKYFVVLAMDSFSLEQLSDAKGNLLQIPSQTELVNLRPSLSPAAERIAYVTRNKNGEGENDIIIHNLRNGQNSLFNKTTIISTTAWKDDFNLLYTKESMNNELSEVAIYQSDLRIRNSIKLAGLSIHPTLYEVWVGYTNELVVFTCPKPSLLPQTREEQLNHNHPAYASIELCAIDGSQRDGKFTLATKSEEVSFINPQFVNGARRRDYIYMACESEFSQGICRFRIDDVIEPYLFNKNITAPWLFIPNKEQNAAVIEGKYVINLNEKILYELPRLELNNERLIEFMPFDWR